MAITKEEYQVFKFFKNTYTKINCAKVIKILSNLDIILEGCKNEEFFVFSGKILENNMFLDHLKKYNLNVEITVDQWKLLNDCLKKNAESVSLSDELAVFTMTNADGTTTKLVLGLSQYPMYSAKKINDIKKTLPENKVEITNYLNSEIIELFEDSNSNITDKHTGRKIIEVPKNRVLSLQRGCSAYIRHSSEQERNVKYVAISSVGESLELEQIFATL